MTNVTQQLRSQVIPLSQESLLLPNSAVAEILPYKPPFERDIGMEDWWLGTLEWRGLPIPLISLDTLYGHPLTAVLPQSRIAVFNTLQGDVRLPFFAVVIAGLPRLLRLDSSQVESDTRELGRFMLSRAMLASGEVIIPDLDAIEAELLRHQTDRQS